nr:immunoglobulin light chain junction region [Macaca mulatta]MOX48336.1 immunoglobulin light chain junction region [Macaca mulatta]MOX48568.1 immunoglobulin light chain junction region [Macaca mulatta]MOX48572.1 immunoglobulin light chain junction region [Macaca mulatta]MOX49431.1 immunoglobulin light chain junction region [Macaca mulatta]
CQHYHSLPFTF